MKQPKSYYPLLATLILLVFWELLSLLINKPFLPTPLEAIKGLFFLTLKEDLLKHLVISLFRILASGIISLIIALPLGIAMGLNQKVDAIVMPFISILYPLPKIVFLPIFIVLLGLGNAPKILIITLIIFFQILVVVRDSVKKIPHDYFISFYTMSQNKWQLIHHVILPSIRGDIATSLRISIGSAIAVLFFAETFVSYNGLGYLILDQMEARNYNTMYGAIIAMSLLGVIFYTLLEKLEKHYNKWQS